MAFKKARQSTGGASLAAPALDAGIYPARLVQIIDLGLQAGSREYPEPKYRMKFTFECMDEFCYEVKEDGSFDEDTPLLDKPRFFHREVTYNPDGYMGENSNIFPMMQVLSPSFSKTGSMEEELGELLGRPVNILLKKYITTGGKNKGKEANSITGITPMKKKEFQTLQVMKESGNGVANLQLVNTPFFFDLDEPTLEGFNKLTKGNQYCDQDKILASTAYAGSKLAILRGDSVEEVPNKTFLDDEQEAGIDEAMAEEAEAQLKEAQDAESAPFTEDDDIL